MTTRKKPTADWREQQRTKEGVHLAGKAELPANHRLRAEALVERKEAKDPDGIVTDELIVDTAERLEREATAAAEAAAAEKKAARQHTEEQAGESGADAAAAGQGE